MDKNGKIKVKAEYLNVGDFSEGLCYVSKEVIKKGYKWIFIDTLGNKVFDIKDNFPETEFSEGFARISSFEEQWFVNKNGVNEFGKTWKDGHEEFKNGIAYVSEKEFSDFYPINIKGERIGTKTFSRVEIYNSRKNDSLQSKSKMKFKSDKFIPFQENELWGFKDSLNNIVIKPKFYKVDKFKNGVCAVRINKREFEFANDYFLDALIDENGKTLIKIEMHFLPDVYVTCETCNGKRYNRETLEIFYKGKSISDVLKMPISESAEFFDAQPAISRILKTLTSVGLGYLTLGQSSTTLSGGEAQRIKLARELSKIGTGDTLYVMDEPTTGLHFQDVRMLVNVIQKLVDKGNTVMVIEHNLDLIKAADWIIDLGPEGGKSGGEIIAEGTPDKIAKVEKSHTGRFLKQEFERLNKAVAV